MKFLLQQPRGTFAVRGSAGLTADLTATTSVAPPRQVQASA